MFIVLTFGLTIEKGTEFVNDRLDRVVCNSEWKILFPKAKAFALPTIRLDHNPILLPLLVEQLRGKGNINLKPIG